MEILEIRMDHFGKFKEQSMTFHPGVNVICGDNESGKSTMRAFIKGMFYGIDKMRGRASQTDEYELRKPWENSAYFSGSLRFESGGKRYRIERNFSKNEKSARLICETDGEELDIAGGDLLQLLDGMSEEAFENTVFFGNQSAKTEEALADAMIAEMINANTTGERIDAIAAMEELQKERKKLEKEKKERVAHKVEEQQEFSTRIDCLQQEADELAKEEQQLRESAGRLKERRRGTEEAADREAFTERLGWKIGKVAMAVIAVIAMAVGLLLTDPKIRAGAAVAIGLACIGVRFFSMRNEEEKERIRELEKQERLRSLRESMKEDPERERLQMNIEWTGNARKEKLRQIEELKRQHASLHGTSAQEDEQEERLSAVYLAIDTLGEAMTEVYQEYVKKLESAASEILSQITDGKYTGIYLDEDFQVRVQTPEHLLGVWQLSRGTMEQIYFSLRMACASFLNDGEPLPLILDDAFIAYDDTRLARTLEWLLQSGRQVLLFTCQKREQEQLIYYSSQGNDEYGRAD